MGAGSLVGGDGSLNAVAQAAHAQPFSAIGAIGVTDLQQRRSNQIVVFDLAPQSGRPHVAGLAQPILNGSVADQSTKKQE